MGNYFRGKDGLTSLHVGLTVVAFAAVVGLIALDAGRGKVMPDELAAEQPTAVAETTSPATAPTDALMARYGLVAPSRSMARDPSVPSDADVIATAKDEPQAPTF
jgi:hypothetical protein